MNIFSVFFGCGISYSGDQHDVKRAKKMEKVLIHRFGKQVATQIMQRTNKFVSRNLTSGLGVAMNLYEFIMPKFLQMDNSAIGLNRGLDILDSLYWRAFPGQPSVILGVLHWFSKYIDTATSFEDLEQKIQIATRSISGGDNLATALCEYGEKNLGLKR